MCRIVRIHSARLNAEHLPRPRSDLEEAGAECAAVAFDPIAHLRQARFIADSSLPVAICAGRNEIGLVRRRTVAKPVLPLDDMLQTQVVDPAAVELL